MFFTLDCYEMSTFSSSPSIEAGVGSIALDVHAQDAVFTELSCAYPLKLLSPRLSQPKVAVAYVVSYGGGLVGGDQVDLSARIEKDGVLVMLTQVSRYTFQYLTVGQMLIMHESRFDH